MRNKYEYITGNTTTLWKVNFTTCSVIVRTSREKYKLTDRVTCMTFIPFCYCKVWQSLVFYKTTHLPYMSLVCTWLLHCTGSGCIDRFYLYIWLNSPLYNTPQWDHSLHVHNMHCPESYWPGDMQDLVVLLTWTSDGIWYIGKTLLSTNG